MVGVDVGGTDFSFGLWEQFGFGEAKVLAFEDL